MSGDDGAVRISPRELHDSHRWISLDEVNHLPGNPNLGDEESLTASIDEFGWFDGIVVHEGVVIAGNHRVDAARAAGEEGLPGYDLSRFPLDTARRMAMAIAHNRTTRLGEDDPTALWEAVEDLPPELLEAASISEADMRDVSALAKGTGGKDYGSTPGPKLTERFIVPPFSVLDARQGYWQTRKREWLSIGMRSELGRDAGLIGKDNLLSQINEGSSVFDPVLCELAYRWFAPDDGRVLDPFAGGAVRGVVAARLGLEYVGVELRPEQIAANEAQSRLWDDCRIPPRWVLGDAADLPSLVDGPFDLVFSCPPFADLEVYSDDPRDLSTLPPVEFLEAHARILGEAIGLLAPDRFVVWCVSEVRDSSRLGGPYLGLVPSTVAAMEAAGASFYNEAILVNAVGTVSLRAPRQFDASRKLGRMHQNIMVGYTGDPTDVDDWTPPQDLLPDAGEYEDAVAVPEGMSRHHLIDVHEKVIVGFNGDVRNLPKDFGPVDIADPAEAFGEVM